jgi:DNA topoisomerase-1
MASVPNPDSLGSARDARLRWVSDAMPGIRRRRHGRSFMYFDADGARVTDPETLQRIRDIAVPPAWTDVWISPDARGHIQATGRDARHRKQYRYHSRWREERDADKYDRMLAFGQALPAIRARVARDLTRDGLPSERVLATVVRLLDVALLRVGNQRYARENNSHGLTTLRSDQVRVDGSQVRFAFRGKSGKQVRVSIDDRRVARALARCTALPGEELFQYVDAGGEPRPVTSDQVNDYLRDISGSDFTAKDFRTWGGTVLTATCLHGMGGAASQRERKRMVAQAIGSVAQQLGNTVAVCRKSYVHPDVLAAHQDGSLFTLRVRTSAGTESDNALSDEERMVVRLLKKRSVAKARRPRARSSKPA